MRRAASTVVKLLLSYDDASSPRSGEQSRKWLNATKCCSFSNPAVRPNQQFQKYIPRRRWPQLFRSNPLKVEPRKFCDRDSQQCLLAVGVLCTRLNARATLPVDPFHPPGRGGDSEYPKASDFARNLSNKRISLTFPPCVLAGRPLQFSPYRDRFVSRVTPAVKNNLMSGLGGRNITTLPEGGPSQSPPVSALASQVPLSPYRLPQRIRLLGAPIASSASAVTGSCPWSSVVPSQNLVLCGESGGRQE